MPSILVQPVELSCRSHALELLFGPYPDGERSREVLQLFENGELAPDGLLGAFEEGSLVGAALCAPAAGAMGLVWPPVVRSETSKALIEDALVDAMCQWLRLHGARIAQLLLGPDEVERAVPLERNGFSSITTLDYLQKQLDQLLPRSSAVGPWNFAAFPDVPLNVFLTTLLRTYEASADVPELDGLRSADEILAGHRVQGRFNPAAWWLLREGDVPLGVVLSNELPDRRGWDLIYLGVVPEARGRGLGKQLIRHVLQQASAAGVHFVEVCVDRRNFFARRLYDELGFRPITERVAWLARLDAETFPPQLDG